MRVRVTSDTFSDHTIHLLGCDARGRLDGELDCRYSRDLGDLGVRRQRAVFGESAVVG